MPSVSVVTPAYNRAHLLPRLHASLLEQALQPDEWVIVDDGSTDNTAQLVASLEAPFPIRYFRHDRNRGMQAAWNRGIAEARGDMIAVIGSDDWYLPHALETLVRHWEAIPNPEEFASVEAMTQLPDGSVSGLAYPKPITDADHFARSFQHRVPGDRMGVIRADVAKRFPFPEEVGESTEMIAWNRISREYRVRFVNDVVGVVDYQPTGVSATKYKGRPAAHPWRLYYGEFLMMRRAIDWRLRLKAAAQYVRFSIRVGGADWRVLVSVPPWYWVAAVPVGIALAVRDVSTS